ncbi:DUF1990 family protein [Vulgatibacter sp.]|uniref:DUF1990 family protein n=1 Tax=Vulgatibacter sp. TaxID=1971226 RepID=UPI003569D36A
MRKRSGSHARDLELLLAEQGFGPLLRRDYWGVIRNCRYTPAQIVGTVRRHFPAFAPRELVTFTRLERRDLPLELGDELDVRIVGVPRTRVRVTNLGEQSLTLATEAGHPEAGRITFGCYRNRHGDVIFHIRSHARSSGRVTRAGFLATGEVMQTSTWTDFVNRVAVAFGDGVIGHIQAVTTPCEDEPPEASMHEPTFEARGG